MNRESRLARLEARAAHATTIRDDRSERPPIAVDYTAFTALFEELIADLPEDELAAWGRTYASWSRSCSASSSR